MRGIIATGGVDPAELGAKGAGHPEDGRRRPGARGDLHGRVRLAGRQATTRAIRTTSSPPERRAKKRLTIAAYDLGIKTEHPATARRAQLRRPRVSRRRRPRRSCWRRKPDGIFLSNGPGDPAALPYVIDNVTQLVASDMPVFGICLGHQVLGLAMGGKTFKLKFGHRGGNHPVKNLATNKVEITSQNHGFAVDPESLPGDVKVTHLNLYDGTVEGLRHVEQARLLRAVPSRGLARAARCGLPVPSVPGRDRRRHVAHLKCD